MTGVRALVPWELWATSDHVATKGYLHIDVNHGCGRVLCGAT